MSNEIVIFTGPSLSASQAEEYLAAVYKPPARQGDIYKAYLEHNPSIIGIIDGYFENVPAPWHKEILFVMSKGVIVFGASSMGALRAAELHQFGMIGVGEVFEAYKSGRLEDDDEVAVIHGPQSLGYPALSEPMVNIRKSAEIALENKIISQQFHDSLLSEAKKIFYKKRTYPVMLEALKKNPGFESEAARFALWTADNRIDIKNEDALRMINEVAVFYEDETQPISVDYHFEHTVYWDNMRKEIEAEYGHSGEN